MEPIKEIVHRVNKAFMDNNMQEFVSLCADDIAWTVVGQKILNGKQEILAYMASMTIDGCPLLTEHTIIVEGSRAACTGSMQMVNPDGSDYLGSFCDIYQFRGYKIQRLESYVVHGKPQNDKLV